MNFDIFTDSSCNLPEPIIDEYELLIFPLTFMVNGEQFQSYLQGEHTDLAQFYDMMRQGKVITTSLPNLAEAEAQLRASLDAGKDVLYLGFSSALSGTYDAISMLMDGLASEYPDRVLRHVNTLAASGGEGLLVYYAAKMRSEGCLLEDVARWVENNRLHLAHWFTVDDLMFLFRGGRVTRTTAWAGTVLNIKPVMHVDNNGRLIPLDKVRGRKKSLQALIDKMGETALPPISEQTVYITHGDCLAEAEYLANVIRERFGVKDIMINWVDPVIGAHSGPGTMALFFLASHR